MHWRRRLGAGARPRPIPIARGHLRVIANLVPFQLEM
jgi:hypothetical protein